LATHRTQKEITAATQRLVEMVSIPPSIIAYSSNRSDTHATTAVVNTWTQEYGAKTMDIPHDVAHIVALANEYHLNNIIGICLDGPIPPLIQQPSGGNVYLLSGQQVTYKAGLQLLTCPDPEKISIPYPLGAIPYVFKENEKVADWVTSTWSSTNKSVVKTAEGEAPTNAPMVESVQYVLDLSAAILGLCYEQTYPGEPGLRLHAAARNGKDVLQLKPLIDGGRVNSFVLLEQLMSQKDKMPRKDLAFSVYSFLGRCFGALSLAAAETYDLPVIGIAGELASQELLVKNISDFIRSANHQVYLNTQVPAGDGGLAFGQAVAAARHYKIEVPQTR
ncbi:MAG: Kae1-like domain-containing protein, partial [Candidatus Ranarchaeia archaeon]